MEIAQAYFALRVAEKNEEACAYLHDDAKFETPNETVAGAANILTFFNANPTPKVSLNIILKCPVPVIPEGDTLFWILEYGYSAMLDFCS